MTIEDPFENTHPEFAQLGRCLFAIALTKVLDIDEDEKQKTFEEFKSLSIPLEELDKLIDMTFTVISRSTDKNNAIQGLIQNGLTPNQASLALLTTTNALTQMPPDQP